ncbi:hypothetical protein D3C72_251950 [compost metagenome]
MYDHSSNYGQRVGQLNKDAAVTGELQLAAEKRLARYNPWVGGILGLFFGPFAYLYTRQYWLTISWIALAFALAFVRPIGELVIRGPISEVLPVVASISFASHMFYQISRAKRR